MKYGGFKKVHEDSNQAILKHKNGSELKIAKRNLSPQHREALQKLPLYAAEGAYVEPKDEPQQPQPTPNQAPVTINIAPTPQPSAPPTVQPQQMPTPTPQPNQAPTPQASQQQQPTSQPQSTLAPLPEEPQEAPNQTEEPQATREPMAAPAPSVETPKTPQIQATPGQQFIEEVTKWGNDISNNRITPKTYNDLLWKDKNGEEKGFFGKIGTMFGLMMSGAGSGLAHQPNMLMHMMDNEIAKDLEAQQKNQSNKLEFGKLFEEHITNQGQLATNQANINHLAMADAQTRDALKQSFYRRAAMDKLYKTMVAPLPQGSPGRAQAESAFGALVQASNASDVSAAAFVDARYNMFKNQENAAAAQSEEAGPVNYDKMNQLQRNAELKMYGAPSASEFEHMTAEAKGLEEVYSLRKDFEKTFQELDSKFLAGSLNPHDRDNAVKALKGKLTRVAEGRYSDSASQLVDSMLPQIGDWKKTRLNKQERDSRFFDILSAGVPTLKRRGLINQYKSNFGSGSAPAHQPSNSLREGRVGTDANGNRVIVKGGKVVPLK